LFNVTGAFPFYVAFATAGYLQFGADVAGDVLTEWRGRDGVMTAAQLAVAGVNALKYPLMGFSLKRAVQKQLAGLWCRRLTPEPSDIHDDGDVADAVTRGGAVMGGGADARCAPFWAEALALLLLHASVAAVALSFGVFILILVWAISVLTSCFVYHREFDAGGGRGGRDVRCSRDAHRPGLHVPQGVRAGRRGRGVGRQRRWILGVQRRGGRGRS
jgi:hypothetical protein